jgi:hypothetical protein
VVAPSSTEEHDLGMDEHGLFFRPGVLDPAVPLDQFGALRFATLQPEIPAAPVCARVELVGSHLRAAGSVDLGNFHRLSDYVNFLAGFFTIRDVTLLSRIGEPTRLTFPDLRVRLDEIAIVGQPDPEAPAGDPEDGLILKQRRRLVVTTAAHIVYGYAYLHEEASLTAFVDATEPRFIPLVDVRVRWLADRRLAGRFPFALVQRAHIVAVATDISGGFGLLAGRRVSEDETL